MQKLIDQSYDLENTSPDVWVWIQATHGAVSLSPAHQSHPNISPYMWHHKILPFILSYPWNHTVYITIVPKTTNRKCKQTHNALYTP